MKKTLLTTVAMATISMNCFASSESTSICELELQQINETGKKPKTYVSSCYFLLKEKQSTQKELTNARFMQRLLQKSTTSLLRLASKLKGGAIPPQTNNWE